ncbi:hypothetical protein BaRGS_00031586 [Batillaria attramentaria]|uniref:Uncharacterized protein n=1 Tax=Batillaria attramentaria TaxID=370345 RepID=A0ABD0JQ49_9CAEN
MTLLVCFIASLITLWREPSCGYVSMVAQMVMGDSYFMFVGARRGLNSPTLLPFCLGYGVRTFLSAPSNADSPGFADGERPTQRVTNPLWKKKHPSQEGLRTSCDPVWGIGPGTLASVFLW